VEETGIGDRGNASWWRERTGFSLTQPEKSTKGKKERSDSSSDRAWGKEKRYKTTDHPHKESDHKELIKRVRAKKQIYVRPLKRKNPKLNDEKRQEPKSGKTLGKLRGRRGTASGSKKKRASRFAAQKGHQILPGV